MTLTLLDWAVVAAYFAIVLAIGLWAARRTKNTLDDYFLSGRNMPWWLLGISMVATTFSSDTPNLVAGLVREQGVAGNWIWWAFLITGMLTVFIFAKLWRRSLVLTDIEFYELRYSGRPAAFLRGFRALYLGFVFNTLVMAAVSLAAIKFGEIVLGWPGWQTLLVAGATTVAYSLKGGLRAILFTDFAQFVLAMVGSVWATIYILGLPEIGGLSALVSHENVVGKLNFLPSWEDPDVYIPVLLMPLAVQWWSSYYPGSEPGGGGYVAQRMFSARDERHAIGATLLFNVAHYALRPWPWILIAFASLVIFPEVGDLGAAFPTLSADKLGEDVAYPAMLTLLPPGLLGLVSASLIAAFMSTISSHLSLGSSYVVNDVYRRFYRPAATERELVRVGRLATLVIAVVGMSLGLLLRDATQAFNLMLLLGAGTGLIYLLRWFWWRINAYTEIVAMVTSLLVSGYFTFADHGLASWRTILLGILITTTVWVASVYLTPATEAERLRDFYRRIRPAGPGWARVRRELGGQRAAGSPDRLPRELLAAFLGVTAVYALLFGTGNLLYGATGPAAALLALAAAALLGVRRCWSPPS